MSRSSSKKNPNPKRTDFILYIPPFVEINGEKIDLEQKIRNIELFHNLKPMSEWLRDRHRWPKNLESHPEVTAGDLYNRLFMTGFENGLELSSITNKLKKNMVLGSVQICHEEIQNFRHFCQRIRQDRQENSNFEFQSNQKDLNSKRALIYIDTSNPSEGKPLKTLKKPLKIVKEKRTTQVIEEDAKEEPIETFIQNNEKQIRESAVIKAVKNSSQQEIQMYKNVTDDKDGNKLIECPKYKGQPINILNEVELLQELGVLKDNRFSKVITDQPQFLSDVSTINYVQLADGKKFIQYLLGNDYISAYSHYNKVCKSESNQRPEKRNELRIIPLQTDEAFLFTISFIEHSSKLVYLFIIDFFACMHNIRGEIDKKMEVMFKANDYHLKLLIYGRQEAGNLDNILELNNFIKELIALLNEYIQDVESKKKLIDLLENKFGLDLLSSSDSNQEDPTPLLTNKQNDESCYQKSPGNQNLIMESMSEILVELGIGQNKQIIKKVFTQIILRELGNSLRQVSDTLEEQIKGDTPYSADKYFGPLKSPKANQNYEIFQGDGEWDWNNQQNVMMDFGEDPEINAYYQAFQSKDND